MAFCVLEILHILFYRGTGGHRSIVTLNTLWDHKSIFAGWDISIFLLELRLTPSHTFLIRQTDWLGLLIKLDLEAWASVPTVSRPPLSQEILLGMPSMVAPVSQVNFKIGHHTNTLVNIIAPIIIWFLRNSKVLCKCFVSQMEALGLIVIQLNSF